MSTSRKEKSALPDRGREDATDKDAEQSATPKITDVPVPVNGAREALTRTLDLASSLAHPAVTYCRTVDTIVRIDDRRGTSAVAGWLDRGDLVTRDETLELASELKLEGGQS